MAGSHPILGVDMRASSEFQRFQTASRRDYDGENARRDSPTTPEFADMTKTHKKLIFTDPVAFAYLERDESTTVVSRRQYLEGYELFIVEKWVVSRKHATFTICTQTPDLSKKVLVDVLAVPISADRWSPRLKVYLDGISQSFAHERQTSLGSLMVTDLNAFPSALNVIGPVSEIRKHREDFIVNENLKRMGCTGRAAMSLQYPHASTVSRFHLMYRTSQEAPLYISVISLAKICQIALHLFGMLDLTYADGLICDMTDRAIVDWWNEIGVDFHNVEPQASFSPTTVAALIGMLVGAHNRLRLLNAPVPKDPTDVSMKRAIGHFQKTNKMDRTRRLDRATLERLHRLTASKADDEGMAVTRALKSTVAGLSGKGGEMIARGLGGGREKAGIAEVETLDIESLAALVTGRSLKWLFQGKEKGLSLNSPSDDLNGRVFSTDDQGNFIWTSSNKEASADSDLMTAIDPEDKERRPGKVREAIGLNHSRHHDQSSSSHDNVKRNTSDSTSAKDVGSTRVSQKPSKELFPVYDVALADEPDSIKMNAPQESEQHHQATRERSDTTRSHRHALRGMDHQNRESPSKRKAQAALSQIREELKTRKYQDFSGTLSYQQPSARGLRRSLSAIQLRSISDGRSSRLPRHLSYSLMSDAIESTREHEATIEQDTEEQSYTLATRSDIIKAKLAKARSLAGRVTMIERALLPFAASRVEKVEYIEGDGQARLEELNNEYYQHLEEYQAMQATSTDLIAREKTSLMDALRSIELLGQKLDYELDSLTSRMQEVEESVDDFEHRVIEIEASVKTLISEEEKDQHPPWYERWVPWYKSQAAKPVNETKTSDSQT